MLNMKAIQDEKVPLAADEHGTIRVGETRVTLLSLVTAFEQGATPESIVQKFPALHLADVYAVIAYYLRHQAEVDSHLKAEREAGESNRREIEKQFPPEGIRERLLKRRQQQGLG